MQHNFKVGDKVKVKPYLEFDFTDELYDCGQMDVKQISEMSFTILEIDTDGDLCLDTDEVIHYNFFIHPNEVILVTPVSTKNPRPHAELIKQWVNDDSLQIQVYCEVHKAWSDISNIIWSEHNEYRIKPKTVTKWKWAYNSGKTDTTLLTTDYFASEDELKEGRMIAQAIKLDWTAKEFEV